jgi:hypothetical protein
VEHAWRLCYSGRGGTRQVFYARGEIPLYERGTLLILTPIPSASSGLSSPSGRGAGGEGYPPAPRASASSLTATRERKGLTRFLEEGFPRVTTKMGFLLAAWGEKNSIIASS